MDDVFNVLSFSECSQFISVRNKICNFKKGFRGSAGAVLFSYCFIYFYLTFFEFYLFIYICFLFVFLICIVVVIYLLIFIYHLLFICVYVCIYESFILKIYSPEHVTNHESIRTLQDRMGLRSGSGLRHKPSSHNEAVCLN